MQFQGTNSRRGATPLAFLASLQAAGFAILCSWALGGNADSLHTPLLLWGSISLPLLIAGLWGSGHTRRRAALPLILLGVLDLVVIASLLNLNHRPVTLEGVSYLVQGGDIPWLPGTPLIGPTLSALWWLNCCVIGALNLYLLVEHRTTLRVVIFCLLMNALALAIFGTLQSFVKAPGLYFGAIRSPNTYFFSTFIYHNHWGAFVVLMMTAALGYCWRQLRSKEDRYRDFWHSPAFLMLPLVFFLALTVPLSAARASTFLMVLTLGGAIVHWLRWLIRRERMTGQSMARPRAVAFITLLLACGAIYWSAAPMLRERYDKTLTQVGTLVGEQGHADGRGTLYRDVITMFSQRPVFGWGMGSFPQAFFPFNTQDKIRRIHPSVYQDAHSDWLQCLAENGLVGSLLIAALALVPLLRSGRIVYDNPFSRYLLLGCGAVLILALFEFPFGNHAVQVLWWLCLFVAARYPTAEA